MNDQSPKNEVPLILFSGMGAGPEVFNSQQRAFPNLVVPDWPSPGAEDDLESYCKRIEAIVDPGCPCFVGGASFGGIIAMEMARQLDALGCFLIGSVRNPSQLPMHVRAARPLGAGIELVPVSLLQRSAASSKPAAKHMGAHHLAGVIHQFSSADPAVIRWSVRQLLKWNDNYDDVITHHIHGKLDRVLPIGNVDPDEVVAGGGHVISMTHGEHVNRFIRRTMQLRVSNKLRNE